MEKKKILIIDDEEIITALLKDSIEKMGYDVEIAHSGMQGLRKAETLKPDVIALDVMMPGMDGINIIKKLKDNPATKDIPVLLMSVAGDSYRKEGLRIGAAGVLKKPLDFRQLETKIRVLTQKKTILVVDDDPDTLKLIEIKLSNSGYVVITAENGQQAINKARELIPSLILLDYDLPDKDGGKVSRELKQDNQTADIPIIMYSGYVSDEVKDREIFGVEKFLGKTFSVSELAEEISKTLK